MFEHFRPLFLCSFQINATILYLSALSIRLRNEPVLLAATLTALIAIFKSYPSIGDVGFYIALLPMWKHLFQCKYFTTSQIYQDHLYSSTFVLQLCNKDSSLLVFSSVAPCSLRRYGIYGYTRDLRMPIFISVLL